MITTINKDLVGQIVCVYEPYANGGEVEKTIKARTFPPFVAASPSTSHLAWKTDARNEFTFTIE